MSTSLHIHEIMIDFDWIIFGFDRHMLIYHIHVIIRLTVIHRHRTCRDISILDPLRYTVSFVRLCEKIALHAVCVAILMQI